MLLTKTRLQGNSVVVTLPPNNGEKVAAGKEYVVVYSSDGTITLVPKLDDPFSDGAEGVFYESDHWEELLSKGREEF